MSVVPLARILVVDDEVAQMKALCNTLQDHGYEATGHYSARAALEEIEKDKFELMLTDLMMPEIDGISLLQSALRKDSGLVGIIMTAKGRLPRRWRR